MKTFVDLEVKQKLIVLGIFLLAFLLWALDAADDLSHGISWYHLLVEGLIISFSAFWLTSAIVRYIVSRKENVKIRADLSKVRSDLEKYQKETQHLVQGLSIKISEQLDNWSMTKAEKEVALLLLKGFSNKEIADLRETSEKTVTQQVSSVYLKSGLRSRSEFAAFFLEDLILPTN